MCVIILCGFCGGAGFDKGGRLLLRGFFFLFFISTTFCFSIFNFFFRYYNTFSFFSWGGGDAIDHESEFLRPSSLNFTISKYLALGNGRWYVFLVKQDYTD